MKVAILGGGFTGLAAAHYAHQKGHEVVLFEKEAGLGGLAAGFRQPEWKWSLERAYHHWFTNDSDILTFAREIGFDKVTTYSPQTSSLFENGPTLTTLPLDSPADLLTFPYLGLIDKVRTGSVLAALKASPFMKLYERRTAEQLLSTTMGERAWKVLWEPLFRKKFGKYAGNILAAFFWARIKKRTAKLNYPNGGFQTFIDHTEKELRKERIDLKTATTVTSITKHRDVFKIEYEGGGTHESARFDAVICTLPSPIIGKVAQEILPSNYLVRFEKLKFLHAVNLILETEKPILRNTYWLNVMAASLPFMVVVAHTNMVGSSHYGGRHLTYIARYVDVTEPIIKADKEEALKLWVPHLEKVAEHKVKIKNAFWFKGPFAQPIFDKEFLRNKPDFVAPVDNFFIANLDMTYPYDRGTNYAVRLGREVTRYL